MPDNILEQHGLPVNSAGEVVARVGTGSRSIAGSLPQDFVPVNAQGEMVVNLAPAVAGESFVTASTNPATGGIGIIVEGKEAGARLGSSAVTYDAQGRVATHDGWTMDYDSAGRAASQTKGTQTQTFNYDTSGRFTSVTEA